VGVRLMSGAEVIRLSRVVPYGVVEFEQRPNGYRAYHVTTLDGPRRRLPSVTTILNVLAKRALLDWYEQMGIESALELERSGALVNVAVADATEILRANKLGARGHLRAAQDRGLSLHKLLQDFADTEAAPNPALHPPEYRGYIKALVRWLLKAEKRGIEFVEVERVVAHPTLGYAGRMDVRASIKGFPFIIDLKTNRQGRVYPDHHYQPVAYAVADEACGAEPVHDCLIVAIGPDGDYDEMRSCASPADWLAVLDVYKRAAELSKAVNHERKRQIPGEAVAA
jgi:hypothetical protein